MSEYGFWNLAQRDPEHLALVEPDGREWRAGELLAEANRLVHGLRALGLRQGDCVATCLPNDAAMIITYLAAMQSGWYHADQSPPDGR
jgi:long-chain acyl-CoA synthetase